MRGDEGCLPQRSPLSHWWATGSLVSWWQTSTEHRLGWTASKENNKSFIEFELVSVCFNGLRSHTNIASDSQAKSRTGSVFSGSTVRKWWQFLFVGATEPKNHACVSRLLWEHAILSLHYIWGADGATWCHSCDCCFNSPAVQAFAAGPWVKTSSPASHIQMLAPVVDAGTKHGECCTRPPTKRKAATSLRVYTSQQKYVRASALIWWRGWILTLVSLLGIMLADSSTIWLHSEHRSKS